MGGALSLCVGLKPRGSKRKADEPYEPRGSRTDLWGTGGEIPPVYPTILQRGDKRQIDRPLYVVVVRSSAVTLQT